MHSQLPRFLVVYMGPLRGLLYGRCMAGVEGAAGVRFMTLLSNPIKGFVGAILAPSGRRTTFAVNRNVSWALNIPKNVHGDS